MKREIKYIGNYKIVDIIGKGGMGKIFTAIHIPLNRIVVLKEMGRNASRRRFKQEALISASLDHKNIVQTYDYFNIGASCYLVMQYIDGMNLAEVIENEGPLHPVTAAVIMREVCCGINHAHSNAIIHRDIKPTNILISRSGEVKITDFGVARGEDSPHLTSTGTVIGTPYYMSPEQASGKKLTAQSDIFSLGIVLYEMITGKKPFSGGNTHAITAKIIRGKYASTLWNSPHHSLRLSKVIDKAMKKNLSRRYNFVQEMCRDLEKFAGWKNVVQSEKLLVNLVEGVEQSKQVTTVVRKPAKKRKRRKKKIGKVIYLYVVLLGILAGLIYYLIKMLLS